MENQEIPSNLTPEEIEQQKKNLEQKQEEKVENPKEEDSAIRLSGINEEIAKKEESMQNTQNKINEIRDGLGLPQSDEIPPSIQSTQDSIEKLNQEKEKLTSENLETVSAKMTDVKSRAEVVEKDGKKFFKFSSVDDENEYKKLQEQFHDLANKGLSDKESNQEEVEKTEETKRFEGNLKTALDDISGKSKTMLDALYERQQDRLTPLQSNENFQMMASSIRNLKGFESKIDTNSVTKLIEDVNKLSQLFDEIKIQQSAMLKENPQNLEKLAYGAKTFSASVEESGRKLPIEMEDKQMEEKSKELRIGLQKLSEQSQKLWLFASKLRENSR